MERQNAKQNENKKGEKKWIKGGKVKKDKRLNTKKKMIKYKYELERMER